jgi:hypothetical protein
VDGHGRGTIAKRLNAAGVESFGAERQRANGKPVNGWGASAVAKILANEAVWGRYQPMSVQGTKDGKRDKAGDPIENYYPVIVDKDLFDQAQGCLEQRKVHGSGGKQSERFNVWQSIAKCVHCGNALHLIDKGKKPKGGQYMQCHRARKGLCVGKLVRLDQSEAVFSGMLARLDALSLVTKDSGQTIKQIQQMDGQLVGKRKQLAQTAAFYDEVPSRALAQKLAVLEAEIEALEQDKQRLQTAVAVANVTSMSLDEFQAKVDLATRDGRHKANTLLTRLGVLVYVGKEEGYAVSQYGRVRFGMAFKAGQAGYLGTALSLPVKNRSLHESAGRALKAMALMGEFIPATNAGVIAYGVRVDAEENGRASTSLTLRASCSAMTLDRSSAQDDQGSGGR